MKLTKQHVDAICQEIRSKELKERNEQIKKLKEDKEIIALAESYFNAFEEIPVEHRPYGIININVQTFINKIIESKLPLATPRYGGELERKITLATIDAADINELKEKLGVDF